MAVDPAPISAARRLALTMFAAMPRRLRLLAVRVIAPSHTVGALCLIEHDGRLLLLQQHHRRGWTLPGGLVNRGETAQQAVVREVREETGLRIEVDLPFTALVEPGARRVDVLFCVPVPHEVDVRPHGEAVRAAWLRPDEAGPVDEPTAAVFDALTRWRRDGSGTGRLL
jgi:8-oxo-dGTP pyrophosphatase MutT (NUDIX family)